MAVGKPSISADGALPQPAPPVELPDPGEVPVGPGKDGRVTLPERPEV